MTFRKPDDNRIITKLYMSVYYWQNRESIQQQQKTYRESNKEKVRMIQKRATEKYAKTEKGKANIAKLQKKYRDRGRYADNDKKQYVKNKLGHLMYSQITRLAKKEGRW